MPGTTLPTDHAPKNFGFALGVLTLLLGCGDSSSDDTGGSTGVPVEYVGLGELCDPDPYDEFVWPTCNEGLFCAHQKFEPGTECPGACVSTCTQDQSGPDDECTIGEKLGYCRPSGGLEETYLCVYFCGDNLDPPDQNSCPTKLAAEFFCDKVDCTVNASCVAKDM